MIWSWIFTITEYHYHLYDHLDRHQDHHHHENHDHQKSDHKGVSIASVIEKFPQNSCAGEEKFHRAPRTKYRWCSKIQCWCWITQCYEEMYKEMLMLNYTVQYHTERCKEGTVDAEYHKIKKKCNRMLNYTVQYMQRRCCWCWITQTFGAMPLTIWLEVGEKNFDAITDALVSFQSSVLLSSSSSALLSPSWPRISKRLTQSVWLLCLCCFCTCYEKGVNILGEKRPIFQAFL